ncbi:MAG: hypothetical protein KJ051_06135 [Thermoleophilia bacterium]|nr:hypothetical protein [Thermoleophilia bacterium]
MARATSKGGRRPRPDARARKPEVAPAPKPKPKAKQKTYEDELFFMRLRRHQKPIFLFLAVAFALSFIILGVGSGNGFLGDIFQGGGGGDSAIESVDDAKRKVEQNPGDPAALEALAEAHLAAAEPVEAAAALEQYVKLAPDDADALQLLASIYAQEAQEARGLRGELQLEALTGSFQANAYTFPGSNGFIGALGEDPIEQAVSNRVAARADEALDKASELYAKQIPVYERLIELAPAEAFLYVQLGEVADNAGEGEKARAAYRTYLELEPEGPYAEAVKAQLAQS